MKNFVNEGGKVTLVAGGAISSGDVIVDNGKVYIAQDDAVSGADFTAIASGVFSLDAQTTGVWDVGDALYWDGSELTGTPTTNDLTGIAVKPKANGETVAQVRLQAQDIIGTTV